MGKIKKKVTVLAIIAILTLVGANASLAQEKLPSTSVLDSVSGSLQSIDQYLSFGAGGILQPKALLNELSPAEQQKLFIELLCSTALIDAHLMGNQALVEPDRTKKANLLEAALQNYLFCGERGFAMQVDTELQDTYAQMESVYSTAYAGRRMLLGLDSDGSLIKARARLASVARDIGDKPAYQILKIQCEQLLKIYTVEEEKRSLSIGLLKYGLIITQLEIAEPKNFWRNKDYEKWEITQRLGLFLQLIDDLESGRASTIAQALSNLQKFIPKVPTTPTDTTEPGTIFADLFQVVGVSHKQKMVLRGGTFLLPRPDDGHYTLQIEVTEAGGSIRLPYPAESGDKIGHDSLGYEIPKSEIRFTGAEIGTITVTDGDVNRTALKEHEQAYGRIYLAQFDTPQRQTWVAHEARSLLTSFTKTGKTMQPLLDALLNLEQLSEEEQTKQQLVLLELAKKYRQQSKYDTASKLLQELSYANPKTYKEGREILQKMNGRFGDRFQDEVTEFLLIDLPITIGAMLVAEVGVAALVSRTAALEGSGMLVQVLRNSARFLKAGESLAATSWRPWLIRRLIVGVPFTIASRGLSRLAGRPVIENFYTDYLLKTSLLITMGGIFQYTRNEVMGPLAQRFSLFRHSSERGLPYFRWDGAQAVFPKLSLAGSLLHEGMQIGAQAGCFTGIDMAYALASQKRPDSVLDGSVTPLPDWLQLLTKNLIFSATARLGTNFLNRPQWEQMIQGKTLSQIQAELARPAYIEFSRNARPKSRSGNRPNNSSSSLAEQYDMYNQAIRNIMGGDDGSWSPGQGFDNGLSGGSPPRSNPGGRPSGGISTTRAKPTVQNAPSLGSAPLQIGTPSVATGPMAMGPMVMVPPAVVAAEEPAKKVEPILPTPQFAGSPEQQQFLQAQWINWLNYRLNSTEGLDFFSWLGREGGGAAPMERAYYRGIASVAKNRKKDVHQLYENLWLANPKAMREYFPVFDDFYSYLATGFEDENIEEWFIGHLQEIFLPNLPKGESNPVRSLVNSVPENERPILLSRLGRNAKRLAASSKVIQVVSEYLNQHPEILAQLSRTYHDYNTIIRKIQHFLNKHAEWYEGRQAHARFDPIRIAEDERAILGSDKNYYVAATENYFFDGDLNSYFTLLADIIAQNQPLMYMPISVNLLNEILNREVSIHGVGWDASNGQLAGKIYGAARREDPDSNSDKVKNQYIAWYKDKDLRPSVARLSPMLNATGLGIDSHGVMKVLQKFVSELLTAEQEINRALPSFCRTIFITAQGELYSGQQLLDIYRIDHKQKDYAEAWVSILSPGERLAAVESSRPAVQVEPAATVIAVPAEVVPSSAPESHFAMTQFQTQEWFTQLMVDELNSYNSGPIWEGLFYLHSSENIELKMDVILRVAANTEAILDPTYLANLYEQINTHKGFNKRIKQSKENFVATFVKTRLTQIKNWADGRSHYGNKPHIKNNGQHHYLPLAARPRSLREARKLLQILITDFEPYCFLPLDKLREMLLSDSNHIMLQTVTKAFALRVYFDDYREFKYTEKNSGSSIRSFPSGAKIESWPGYSNLDCWNDFVANFTGERPLVGKQPAVPTSESIREAAKAAQLWLDEEIAKYLASNPSVHDLFSYLLYPKPGVLDQEVIEKLSLTFNALTNRPYLERLYDKYSNHPNFHLLYPLKDKRKFCWRISRKIEVIVDWLLYKKLSSELVFQKGSTTHYVIESYAFPVTAAYYQSILEEIFTSYPPFSQMPFDFDLFIRTSQNCYVHTLAWQGTLHYLFEFTTVRLS